MPTRKDQIDAFKKAHLKTNASGKTVMVCTREEFLAYAFIRGRNYQSQERIVRKDNEPDFFDIIRIVNQNFPAPEEVPVPVGAGDEDKTWRAPWRDVDYENLNWQLGDWLKEEAPDQKDWEDSEHAVRIRLQEKAEADRKRYTPEYIEELRAQAKK